MPSDMNARHRLGRRRLLGLAGVAVLGGAGLALAGCGEDAGPVAPVEAIPGALQFPLISGWYRDEEARYYEFGDNTPATGGAVSTAPLWVFITGMDARGVPMFVEGQPSVVDTAPGEPGYSDLWEIMLVTVPEGFEVGSIRSIEEVRESGFPTEPAGMLVNCPFVPEGSELAEGPELDQGWNGGAAVFYPDFGLNPASANPMLVLITGFDADGEPVPVEGQGNIIDVIPGQEGYSSFWRKHLVTVPAGYAANEVRSAAAVRAAGWEITVTDEVVNCPVVSPRE